MHASRKSLPFWRNGRMISAEITSRRLVFDPDHFFRIVRSLCAEEMSTEDIESNLKGFNMTLTSDFLADRNRPKYDKVAQIVLRAIRNHHPDLNRNTRYHYEETAAIQETLEDIFTALCSNGNQLWVTATPIKKDSPYLEVLLRQISPVPKLLQKLGIEPKVIDQVHFDTRSLSAIEGSSVECFLYLDDRRLRVNEQSFRWLE